MTIPTSLQANLKKYQDRFPLPVVSLANDAGIEVYSTSDLRDGQSGMIKKEGDGYVIYVNDRHPATRTLFTIAHEIAHFYLHKELLDNGEEHIDWTRQPVNGDCHVALNRDDTPTLSPEARQREKDANQLAAEILMPEEEFKKIFEASSSIEEVAEKFGVSPAAATIRARSLLGEVIF